MREIRLKTRERVIEINKVILIGRWTKDLELKFTPGTGTAVARGTLAVDRRQKKGSVGREADFIPVAIWGKAAENAVTYTGKGKLCGVSGRIQTRNYEAKDGSKRYVTEIMAEEVKFLEWISKDNSSSPYDGLTPVDDPDAPF